MVLFGLLAQIACWPVAEKAWRQTASLLDESSRLALQKAWMQLVAYQHGTRKVNKVTSASNEEVLIFKKSILVYVTDRESSERKLPSWLKCGGVYY